MDDYIAKPIKAEDIHNVLTLWLPPKENGLFVVSCGIEEKTYRRCDHVNHGHKGLGVAIASCS